ncbi:SPW repeat domain-containing protein [Dyadobacter sandarakinus]|uniref:SPW repeat protein n=1 Tax=Dyadobacter sandarakinus TaxID=2747268 RepID=A0ABX7I3K5_9BACT|nr:SPW repeat protein [Dyadobacter sandarakinus]QRR00639.1 SPW repeat protein [Dyadobacter sandarakinus]
MQFISTKFHSKLDYIVGLFLIASPWIFNFNDTGPGCWMPIIAGFVAVIMSLFTDYEGGIVRSIPMPVHLAVDAFSGLALAASPWLLGFADEVFIPHLVFGLFEIAAATLTSRRAFAHD